MERRSFARTPVYIDKNLVNDNILYSGTIVNLSEMGVYINSKANFPSDAFLGIGIRKKIFVAAKLYG